MSRFEKMHPLLQLMFFVITLLVPIAVNHPCFSFVSLLAALLYAFVSGGKRAWKTLLFSLVVTLAVGLFNFLFAHYGADILFTLGDTIFTLEALFYGLHQGVLLASVFIWFTFFGKILDSERVIYLFRFAPKLALTFSMVLGFIPRFLKKLEDIRAARLALCGGEEPVGIKAKLRTSLNDFSALVSYSLEAGIITADSMSARNYAPRAVSPKRFRMMKYEAVHLVFYLVSVIYIVLIKINGDIAFVYEPRIYSARLSLPALCVFLFFEISISVLDVREKLKWKKSRAKM